MASKKKNKRISSGHKPQTVPGGGGKTEPQKSRNRKAVVPGSWKINLAIFFLFVFATVLFYSGALQLGFFAVDDPQYVQNNPWITSISSKNLKFIFTEPYFANFSPIHLLSYMIDYSIAGPDAYSFHLSNNIWAGIVSGFVFLTTLALTSNRIIAILAAALYVVHPVHVEAVAWISSRKDLVAAAFALPSLLTYLYYRRGGEKKWRWYILSLILFAFAAGGKLSVATFPAVFLAIDFFIEKRPLARSILDKLPFIGIGLIIASVVVSAQPHMGNRLDAYVLMQSAVQNFWLLTGFGNYVIYRETPESGNAILQLAGAVLLLLLFIMPYFFRRRFPLAMVMIYWMLFLFIPSQVLSFTHPVTDRYLFFPSVAAVILIAWGIVTLFKTYLKRYINITSGILIAIILFFWAIAALKYLAEWKDPRSVWYAALNKSEDPAIPQNLGSYYVDLSRKFNPGMPDSLFPVKEKKHLAELMWAGDPRLPALISEWDSGQRGGTIEKEFQEHIRTEALNAFTVALQKKGNRVMPGIYYNRGTILLERGDLEGARNEYQATLDEVAKESFVEVREQLTVYSYYGFGIIEYKRGNYAGAKAWYEKANQAQKSYGRIWIARLPDDIKALDQIMGL